MNGVRRPFVFASVGIAAVGAVGLAVSWQERPPVFTAGLMLVLLAAWLSENYAFSTSQYSVSLAYPLTMAAILIGGPTSAAVVAALTAVNIAELRSKTQPTVLLFNFGQLICTTLLAGWTYQGFSSLVPSTRPGIGLIAAVVTLTLTAVVGAVSNVGMSAVGIATKSGTSLKSTASQISWLPAAQLAMAGVGFLIGQATKIEPLALPLLVFPLLVSRQYYQHYAGLRDALTDTLRTLIAAVEAKDPYTRGHSERVARLSVRLGRTAGMHDTQVESLEQAALLHDIGKLSIPGAVLRKPGALSEDEWQLVRKHPAIGAEMVQRIPVLKHLSEAVEAHHERVDGNGYPGTKGESDFPFVARILAIADAYDAMTSGRAYRGALPRDDALAEIAQCSGEHFDSELASLFIKMMRQPSKAVE